MFEKEIELKQGENILLRTRAHPGLMAAGIIMIFYSAGILIFTDIMPGFVFTGFGLVFFTTGFIRWSYSEYILTDSRLLNAKGYYYIRVEEMLLENVGHVSLWQNVMDKYWDRGVITLFGIGIRTKKMRGIANARKFKNAIHSQLSVEPDHYFE